jgi:hemerythrin
MNWHRQHHAALVKHHTELAKIDDLHPAVVKQLNEFSKRLLASKGGGSDHEGLSLRRS